MRVAFPALMFAALAALAADSPAAEKDARVYEMRVYYAAPGKLDALNARFRDHTAKLFEKHPHFTIFPGESVEVMPVLPIPGG